MANADQVYVDPSSLRSSYIHDNRSARFCAWRKRIWGSLPITRFGRAEIVNSIQLAVHRKIIKAAAALESIADLDADLREGRLVLVDVPWRRMFDLSVDLSVRHSAKLGTRSLDVLHVAAALSLRSALFVTYDKRQATLAKVAGLRTLGP